MKNRKLAVVVLRSTTRGLTQILRTIESGQKTNRFKNTVRAANIWGHCFNTNFFHTKFF